MRGASLLCPQKQCLSGKTDRLSERTNQKLPLHKGVLPPDSTPKRCNTLYLVNKACEKEYEQIVRTPFLFRQVLLLRVILSVVRPRSCSADASHCYAVRLRYASLRMTRADAVETRRANSNAVRISRGNKPALWKAPLVPPLFFTVLPSGSLSFQQARPRPYHRVSARKA